METLEESILLAVKEKNQKKNVNVEVVKEVVEEQAIEQETQTTAEQTEEEAQFLGVDLSSPTWDLFIIVFFVIAALLYGLSLGRDRIIVILVSIYMSLAVVQSIPEFVLEVGFNDQFAFQITTFIAVFIVLFFLISRSALLRTIGSGSSSGKWYQTIVFSILHVGLLISITMSFLPATIMEKFAPMTQQVFTNEWAAFGWILAPIVAMILFGNKNKE